MATSKQTTARTAVMKRYQDLKNKWSGWDAMNQTQQRNLMAAQGWISNIKPGDVSFGTWSQTGQGSAYNMYPTWSYDTQFARYWDWTDTWNPYIDQTSNWIIWQFAQLERAITPETSAYIDSANALNQANKARLDAWLEAYKQWNANMQAQSDAYYNWLWQYNQSEQSAQQAFAANEALRATWSEQAAQAAWQRVGAQYVWQSLDAQSKKYAEDKALFNELTNAINAHNAWIKAWDDQYDLGVRDKLLQQKMLLATSLANQQTALLWQNLWANLNEQAAQIAFIRQQALAQQQADLAKWIKTNTTAAALPNSTPSTILTNAITQTSPSQWLTYVAVQQNADQSIRARWSDGKIYNIPAVQVVALRNSWKLK